jgi:lupus La protein
MLKFNRLAQITTDLTEIAAALEKSELIELSDDKTKIRRSPEVPLPDNTLEYWQEIKRRTAYVVSQCLSFIIILSISERIRC